MAAKSQAMSLTAIPMDLCLRMLQPAGGQRITRAHLEADRNAGAPITADGSVNLIAYAAWLAREQSHGS